jgi:DNA (cytosine-5)-methyltransferase 1
LRRTLKNNLTKLLYIDLFCGAGGTSEGVRSARIGDKRCAEVIACVDHDETAIKSHAANHPEAPHFREDIRTLDLAPLAAHTRRQRQKYPNAKLVLWASLECTNFSNAKGGKPRDPDSRTLAEHLFRYIDALKPDYLQIENVREFMAWGDLDEKGKPVARTAGKHYAAWVAAVCGHGYRFEYRLLNSADYGARTSRTRFFGIFARHGLPIVFPKPTHAKTAAKNEQSGKLFADRPLLPWRPVAEVLDLAVTGESIFGRKKPLVDATLERIYAGLVKFVVGGCEPRFIQQAYTSQPDSVVYSIKRPAHTLTCTGGNASLVTAVPSFLFGYYSGGNKCHLAKGANCHPVTQPALTIPAQSRIACVTPSFLVNQYSASGTGTPLSAPSPTLMTQPKQNLVHLLYNPQYARTTHSIDKPSFTLIARMDKNPPYLLTMPNGAPAIRIDAADTPVAVKIKRFMAEYGIADICMRMLTVAELKRITGFSDNYVLYGNVTKQKKQIGNAVVVEQSRALCEALASALINR